MNVAFKHAYESSRTKFQCFMFHDVDLLPENDYNIYECDKNEPRHLAPAVDELRYLYVRSRRFKSIVSMFRFSFQQTSLMYNDLVGGVLAITKEQFLRANGWSNLYWGWGVSWNSSFGRYFISTLTFIRTFASSFHPV